jgi:hypothetical protein
MEAGIEWHSSAQSLTSRHPRESGSCAFGNVKALDSRFRGNDEIKYVPFNSKSIPLPPA